MMGDFPPQWERVSDLPESGQGHTFIVKRSDGSDSKLYVLTGLKNPKREEYFKREIEACMTLDHPNVLKVLEHGQTPKGKPFLITGYCTGGSLESGPRFTKPGVVEIGISVESEDGGDADQLEPGQLGGKLLFRMHRLIAVEFRSERLGAFAINARFVHAGGVKIADLLIEGGSAGRWLCGFFQNFPLNLQIPVGEFIEPRPARLVGRNRILGAPVAAHVLIEICARADIGVHRPEINPGLARLGLIRCVLRKRRNRQRT